MGDSGKIDKTLFREQSLLAGEGAGKWGGLKKNNGLELGGQIYWGGGHFLFPQKIRTKIFS